MLPTIMILTHIKNWTIDLFITEFITDSIKVGVFDKILIKIKLFLNLKIDRPPTTKVVINKIK